MGFINQLTTWRHHRGKIFADEQLIVLSEKEVFPAQEHDVFWTRVVIFAHE